ncbi:NPCBM/NEW2 domain-containing protein [Emticicia sp. BO119]|uniref:NPCBM/NEW2 domain-containing protein n=1 Tax=Emticicia sp. BO119 TaxID=2757768 RepID=UPI0015F03DBA|nr:NPCBM/NEW2 domain-containing protein [Emticicia sp. BO119]MBA4853550.1 NPCBM/NEW2 domain-containing protein [Emticicia sp. BO119]
MTIKSPYYLSILLLTIVVQVNAQISITFPMEKAVFQRNQNNLASLSIAGSFPPNITINRVEARLVNPLNENQVIGWATIHSNPTGGVFNGTLTSVPGGWYRLELRSFANNNEINGTATLNHVGVGEVFLIAGQSNAQGIGGIATGASDERVVTHNEVSWYNEVDEKCDNKFPSYPALTQLSDGYISKTGLSTWAYGKLGDLLTSRLGVPIAFFNAAATSTSSINWKESSDGQATVNHYNGSQTTFCNQLGVPYSGLKRVMNYYASIFGVRAILWHQGETDNFVNTITGAEYQNNISYVINKSRNDFGSTISWVISKATLFNYNDTQADIRVAQQNLGSNNGNKLFSGPDTDVLGASFRQDDVHFNQAGIIELANLWDAALNSTFFNEATPIPAKILPAVGVSQVNSEFQLTAPGGYVSYKWVRLDIGNSDYEDTAESTSQMISRTNGTYRCYLTDNLGNITFTQSVICGCSGALNCSDVTYLSNMVACTAISGLDAVKYDQSHDGHPIKLKGITYPKGIGCHANSEITYKLNGNFGRFITHIGIDDEIAPPPTRGSVYFRVYADNALRYESPLLSNTSATIKLNIDVQGVQELKLITNQGPDNFNFDHTDWAGARLHCVDGQAPSIPQNLSVSQVGQNCATVIWNASTDNMEVEKYEIYLDGILVGSVDAPITSYNIQGLDPSHYYTVKVKAKDFSENISDFSNIAEIVTSTVFLVAASPQTINVGQSAILDTYGCTGGAVIWSPGISAQTQSVSVSPTVTTEYSASCKIGNCISNPVKITVKVIPDCANSYNLSSPADDFYGSNVNLIYRASTTVKAQNLILPDSKIVYQAGQSITLQPGFQAELGTVFRAQVAGCN